MAKIYSYVLRYDDGAAPNPYGNLCTLAICKPVIRSVAQVGDWVIGTGSKRSKCNDGKVHDLAQYLVYAMKISRVLSMQAYTTFCREQLSTKIPAMGTAWPGEMGDCIYDFSQEHPMMMPNKVHNVVEHQDWDLNGKNVLLSDHFYYFGEQAVFIPYELQGLIKRNQGHRKITDAQFVERFEQWITKFDRNGIYGDPQLRHRFDNGVQSPVASCRGARAIEQVPPNCKPRC